MVIREFCLTHTVKLLLASAAVAFVMVNAQGASSRSTLASPFARAETIAAAPTVLSGKINCEEPPAAVRDIVTVSKFGSDGRLHDSTVIDPDDAAEYATDVRAVTVFSRRVSRLADGFADQSPTGVRNARCALLWMNDWAEQDALLGRVNPAGEAVRKWELGTLAAAYLKIRNAPHDPVQAQRVRKWLAKLARAVQSDYSRNLKNDSRANNHINWAAWSVMAAAIAADDEALFDWSLDRFRFALAQIDADGTLPLELKRRQLALAYHDFALAPLLLLQEGAAANDVSLTPSERAGLQRLIDLVLFGLADPRAMEFRTGYVQDLTAITPTQLAWLEPYYARTRDPRAKALLDQYRPLISTRLGGNLTLLFGEPGAVQSAMQAQAGATPQRP